MLTMAYVINAYLSENLDAQLIKKNISPLPHYYPIYYFLKYHKEMILSEFIIPRKQRNDLLALHLFTKFYKIPFTSKKIKKGKGEGILTWNINEFDTRNS